MDDIDPYNYCEENEELHGNSSTFHSDKFTKAIPSIHEHPLSPDLIAQAQAKFQEYKTRCARNGMCPNDGKPCKYYRNCVLEKTEACYNYIPKNRQASNGTARCLNCKHFPTSDSSCGFFHCMVAHSGR